MEKAVTKDKLFSSIGVRPQEEAALETASLPPPSRALNWAKGITETRPPQFNEDKT